MTKLQSENEDVWSWSWNMIRATLKPKMRDKLKREDESDCVKLVSKMIIRLNECGLYWRVREGAKL